MTEVVPQEAALPSVLGTLGGQDLPIGVMAILDERLDAKFQKAANRMANSTGMVGPHLLGKVFVCYAVLIRALTWRLDPYAVAASTYATPGGKIGYEGKLVQAILENSGRLIGGVSYEHFGDWTKVEGKFKKQDKVYVATYTEADEAGLGVKVRAHVKGEAKPREIEVTLRSCHPRNSTQWALRPKIQICYAAARVFANVAVPSLFMGVPFSTDVDGDMIDVTPERPMRQSFVETMQEQPKQTFEEVDTQAMDGEAATAAQDEGGGTAASEEQNSDGGDGEKEFTTGDAFEQGRQAFIAGRALRAVPPEWRDNDSCLKFVEAWQEGWKAAEADKTKK